MAVSSRLYPPNIAGTLPSFYKNTSSGTADLVVPFSMNAAVSQASVAGFYLRLKTTTTDTLLLQTSTTAWDRENYTVTFTLTSDVLDKMIIGNYYKAQIAYQSITGIVGYYSTSSIIKYTALPQVVIQGLTSGMTTSTSAYKFIGQYTNTQDISEKVYSYRWTLQGTIASDENIIVKNVDIDTGWLIHDSSTDESNSMSIDDLELAELLSSGTTYKIQYSITTNNGLVISSPVYSIISTTNLGEILPFTIAGVLDYENARIRLNFQPKYQAVNKFSGSYQLVRSDSRSGYLVWSTLGTFALSCSFENWVYFDYTVESGIAYKYGIERISNNIRSSREETVEAIPCYFEYAYLFDGVRQLKIAFNANINSFKEVIAETKKTTLGSKYPFVLRNGILKYKEFPITGTISYLMDKDVLFMPQERLLDMNLMKTEADQMLRHTSSKSYIDSLTLGDYEDSTDISDRNVAKEKNFALFALSWLNNGEIKLFKSPNEGNYIVKLLNVSLSPFNGTGRMIHNFNCTADEVQDFNTTALLKYNLLPNAGQDADGSVWTSGQETVSIAAYRDNVNYKWANADIENSWNMTNAEIQATRNAKAVEEMKTYDFTQGKKVTALQFTNVSEGLIFEYGSLTFMIPKTGSYKITNNLPLQQPLKIQNPSTTGMRGTIIISYEAQVSDTSTFVDSAKVKVYLGYSAYGDERTDLDLLTGQSGNILKEFNFYKKKIIKIYGQNIHTYPLRERVDLFSSAQSVDSSLYTSEENYIDADKYKGKYGRFLVLHNTNPNAGDDERDKYWKWSDDVDDSELTDFAKYRAHMVETNWDTIVHIGAESNPPLDITRYAEGNFPSIDPTDDTQVNYTLGASSFVNFYLLVQEYDFGLEQTNSELINQLNLLAERRKEYLKLLFHFKEITTITEAADTGLYIYEDERFVPIPQSEWRSNSGLQYYTVNSSPVYDRAAIQQAYNVWLEAFEQYNTVALKSVLENEGGIIIEPTEEQTPVNDYKTASSYTYGNITQGFGTLASVKKSISAQQKVLENASTYPQEQYDDVAAAIANSTAATDVSNDVETSTMWISGRYSSSDNNTH